MLRRGRAALLFLLALAVAALLPRPALALDRAAIDRQFRAWLQEDLWPEARKLGVSQAVFAAAFKGVTPNLKLPDLVLPGEKPAVPRKQHQAEFGAPGAYLSEKALAPVVSGGRARLQRFGSTPAAVEKRYGVPGPVVLAIWGRESGFGTVKIPYDAFEVLGTKAFMATRSEMFRKEVLAALLIVERGYIGARAMKSSWAGALGQPQFLPSSFLDHAVDFDGDGRRDIWNSTADTLGSIAHYLARHGWDRSRGWGVEVSVPATVSCALEGPGRERPVGEWAALGVSRIDGRPFAKGEAAKPGILLMPAGRHGPSFLVTPNFYVLKDYNTSDLYALFVGHAADRMQGAAAIRGAWGAVGGLYRSDVAALQRRLEKVGYDVGGTDGLPGYKTRRSIGEWQETKGRAATCFPDAALVKELAKR